MPGCPNSTESGCRCPEHDPGLSVHAQNPVAYAAALKRCQPTSLRVLTMPPSREKPCAGTMTCSCKRCVGERQARPAIDAGPAQFKVRAPRSQRRAA